MFDCRSYCGLSRRAQPPYALVDALLANFQGAFLNQAKSVSPCVWSFFQTSDESVLSAFLFYSLLYRFPHLSSPTPFYHFSLPVVHQVLFTVLLLLTSLLTRPCNTTGAFSRLDGKWLFRPAQAYLYDGYEIRVIDQAYVVMNFNQVLFVACLGTKMESKFISCGSRILCLPSDCRVALW